MFDKYNLKRNIKTDPSFFTVKRYCHQANLTRTLLYKQTQMEENAST